MPEYYSQGNSVLGSRPVPRSVEPSHPNTLLAGLILLLCCGLVALMAWLRPAGGNANLASSVVYVLALFDDNTTVPSTGWVSAAGLVTTRQAAFPRGPGNPPAQYRVYLRAGTPTQQEATATVAGKGSGPTEQPLAGNYALLKLQGEVMLPPLDTASEPPSEGEAVWVRGYDGAQQSPALQTIEGRIARVVAKDGRLEGLALEAQLPKSFDGAPVTNAAGQVVGMYVHGVTLEGHNSWALPATALAQGQ